MNQMAASIGSVALTKFYTVSIGLTRSLTNLYAVSTDLIYTACALILIDKLQWVGPGTQSYRNPQDVSNSQLTEPGRTKGFAEFVEDKWRNYDS